MTLPGMFLNMTVVRASPRGGANAGSGRVGADGAGNRPGADDARRLHCPTIDASSTLSTWI